MPYAGLFQYEIINQENYIWRHGPCHTDKKYENLKIEILNQIDKIRMFSCLLYRLICRIKLK